MSVESESANSRVIIKDIRFFDSDHSSVLDTAVPEGGAELLGIPLSSYRVGARIACLLRSQGFSLGSYHHLYIVFTPLVPEGQVVPTDVSFEPWQRYAAYGLPASFKTLPEEDKLRRLQDATFQTLRVLAPESLSLLRDAEEQLQQHGDRTRILRWAKETEAYRFEVWYDVPAWRETAYLYVKALDKRSGQVSLARPLTLKDYEDAFPLVSTISFTKGIVRLNPRKSFRAGLSTKAYKSPLEFPLVDFE